MNFFLNWESLEKLHFIGFTGMYDEYFDAHPPDFLEDEDDVLSDHTQDFIYDRTDCYVPYCVSSRMPQSIVSNFECEFSTS
jgi:hypothetical protein